MTRGLGPLLAVGVGVLGGCDLGIGSDPYTGASAPPCLPGHVRGADACLLPAAPSDVDGETSEWDGRAELAVEAPCASPPCDGLLPGFVQAVTYATGDEPGWLFVRVALAGGAAPDPDDPDVRWTLVMAQVAGSANRVTDRIVVGGGAPSEYRRADAPLRLLPTTGGAIFALAWTVDGFEAWVARNFLPVLDALVLVPGAQRRDGTSWVDVADVTGVTVCIAAVVPGADPCEVRP